MSKQFWFGGRSCAEFGMMPTGAGFYNAPERDTERISVEGRNGDLIIDKGRYKNVPLQIPVSICQEFPRKAAAARTWLLQESGYRRLESDYDPEHYRMAAFVGPLDFDVKFLNRAAEATLEFTCKPQRFLKAGESFIGFSEPCTIRNPTGFPALPKMIVWSDGVGEVSVGGVTVQFKGTGIYQLDCDTMNTQRLKPDGQTTWVNANDQIYAPEYPVLGAGETAISLSDKVLAVRVIPRWWTL